MSTLEPPTEGTNGAGLGGTGGLENSGGRKNSGNGERSGGNGGSQNVAGVSGTGMSSGGMGGVSGAGGGSPTNSPVVLYIVGEVPLLDSDQRVSARLQQLGFTVQLVDDSNARRVQTSGSALIVVSSTADGDAVRPTFRDDMKPVILWEPQIFDDLGLLSGFPSNNRGHVDNATTLRIVDAASPLAAGLSGTINVSSAPTSISFGRSAPHATCVAELADQPGSCGIFAYERDAEMPGRRAPARRVGFFFYDATPLTLTEDGWRLFDAAVRWATAT